MINIINKVECCGCEACYNICPTDAIMMSQDSEGFFYPEINKEQCISCNRCDAVCPILHQNEKQDEQQRAYACYNKDEQIRFQSTSGGIFTAVAEYLLERYNAIVYGAVFDDGFQVVYNKACNKDELEALRGSKYVQCRVGQLYCEIKSLLSKGENILFSGLPCQIEALKRYLGKQYSNLYTIDMVCFGVGSPLIWKNYLKEFHNIEAIEKITFKNKKEGWKHWKVKFVEGGNSLYYERSENLYMNSYLTKTNIRPSCFYCPFKGLHRESDFTIADCWGIGEQNTRMNDDKGLSALVIHTNKAQHILEAIRERVVLEEYSPEELMEGNWAMFHSAVENKKRKSFFEELQTNDFKSVFIKYFGK